MGLIEMLVIENLSGLGWVKRQRQIDAKGAFIAF
jgi:hypothetical protein